MFQVVRGQVLTAGFTGEVMDLNHPAVWQDLAAYGHAGDTDLFDKIVFLHHQVQRLYREQRERREARRKAAEGAGIKGGGTHHLVRTSARR